jgi:hypothetical protein
MACYTDVCNENCLESGINRAHPGVAALAISMVFIAASFFV